MFVSGLSSDELSRSPVGVCSSLCRDSRFVYVRVRFVVSRRKVLQLCRCRGRSFVRSVCLSGEQVPAGDFRKARAWDDAERRCLDWIDQGSIK